MNTTTIANTIITNVESQEHASSSVNNNRKSNNNNRKSYNNNNRKIPTRTTQCLNSGSASSNSKSVRLPTNYPSRLPTDDKIAKINNLLFATENNMINDMKSKYILVRLFINKVLEPLSIYCLTDFVKVSKELLTKNEQRNRDLLRAYSETFNKILGTKSVITKDTPDDKIKKDYIIKFIKQSVNALGYVMSGKIINKTTRETQYTISLLPNMIIRK